MSDQLATILVDNRQTTAQDNVNDQSNSQLPTLSPSQLGNLKDVAIELTVVMKNMCNEQKQMMCAILEDMKLMAIAITDSIGTLSSDHDSPARKKRKKNNEELENLVHLLNDYIKARVAVDIIDYKKGENVFPRTALGEVYNSVTIDFLRDIGNMTTKEENTDFLCHRLILGRKRTIRRHISTTLKWTFS